MARLGDICEIVSGTTPKTNIPEYWGGEINWITPAEIDENTQIIFESERKITNKAVQSGGLSPFPAGTVVLSSRAPIGKVAIAGVEMYCNQGFKNLICSEVIYNKYLYWFLKSKTDYLNSLGRGATFKEISKEIVSNIDVPLRSLEEQHYIADLLDKISSLISLRKQQLAKLDELVKARFVEMFGDPVKNDRGWPTAPLGEIAEIRIGPFGSMLHKDDYIEKGHALVNPSHIIDGKIVIDPKLTISDEKYFELSSYALQPGDVVLGRRGEMGRCAVACVEGLLCGTGSMIIRSKGKLLPYFLQNILSSPGYKKIIEDKAVGVTMLNLNIPIVSALEVPLLPLREQNQYICFLKKVDEIKLTTQQGLDKLEMVKKTLMQEYFGGGVFA